MGLILNLLFPLEGPNVVYIYEPELNTLETLNYTYMISFFLLFFYNRPENKELIGCTQINYIEQSTQTVVMEINAFSPLANNSIVDYDFIVNWIMLLI